MAAAVEEPTENARSKLAALKAKRDELETELLNLYSQLRKVEFLLKNSLYISILFLLFSYLFVFYLSCQRKYVMAIIVMRKSD